MRELRNRQLELGEIRIEDIKLNLKFRDGVPALLIGLQYLFPQKAWRDRLFAIMDECILPGINRKVGRPGMAMWNILVMSVVKQGLGCDFDWLHELVNEHKTLRKFLGHISEDDYLYHYQTLVDNVSLLNPKLLGCSPAEFLDSQPHYRGFAVPHCSIQEGAIYPNTGLSSPIRGRFSKTVVKEMAG